MLNSRGARICWVHSCMLRFTPSGHHNTFTVSQIPPRKTAAPRKTLTTDSKLGFRCSLRCWLHHPLVLNPLNSERLDRTPEEYFFGWTAHLDLEHCSSQGTIVCKGKDGCTARSWSAIYSSMHTKPGEDSRAPCYYYTLLLGNASKRLVTNLKTYSTALSQPNKEKFKAVIVWYCT